MAELHTEGLQFILEAAFSKEQVPPANFYLGICTDASLAEDATLASIAGEWSGNGYARQAVPSTNVGFVSAAAGTNDRKVTTAMVTFTASGGALVGGVTAFLCTVSAGIAGKLIASQQLSTTRTLQDGDSLNVSMIIQLNG